MRYWPMDRSLFSILIMLFSLAVFTGCDSGKDTIDAVTGNQAVKQYQKSEEDIKDIADQQSGRLESIPEDDEEDEEDEEE